MCVLMVQQLGQLRAGMGRRVRVCLGRRVCGGRDVLWGRGGAGRERAPGRGQLVGKVVRTAVVLVDERLELQEDLRGGCRAWHRREGRSARVVVLALAVVGRGLHALLELGGRGGWSGWMGLCGWEAVLLLLGQRRCGRCSRHQRHWRGGGAIGRGEDGSEGSRRGVGVCTGNKDEDEDGDEDQMRMRMMKMQREHRRIGRACKGKNKKKKRENDREKKGGRQRGMSCPYNPPYNPPVCLSPTHAHLVRLGVCWCWSDCAMNRLDSHSLLFFFFFFFGGQLLACIIHPLRPMDRTRNRILRQDDSGAFYRDIPFVPSGTLAMKTTAAAAQTSLSREKDAVSVREVSNDCHPVAQTCLQAHISVLPNPCLFFLFYLL